MVVQIMRPHPHSAAFLTLRSLHSAQSLVRLGELMVFNPTGGGFWRAKRRESVNPHQGVGLGWAPARALSLTTHAPFFT